MKKDEISIGQTLWHQPTPEDPLVEVVVTAIYKDADAILVDRTSTLFVALPASLSIEKP